MLNAEDVSINESIAIKSSKKDIKEIEESLMGNIEY